MIMKITHGFLMLELLVAILIMALMAFVCMGYYAKTMIIQRDTELYFQATTIASSALEKLLSEKIVPMNNQQKEGLFSLNYTFKPFTSDGNFVIVEVIVTWQSALKVPRTITLTSGFVPKEVV
jgi:type II secretory pathway pseudopilin PulG